MGEAQESSAACLTKGGRERRERERERGGERERRHDVDNDVWYVVLRQAFERLHPRERLETGQAQVATPRGSSETKACRDGLGRTVGILFGWFRLRELRDTSPTEAGEGRRRRALLSQRQSKLAHHGRCRRREWLVSRRSRPGLVCAGALAPRRSRREELIHFRGRPLQHSRLRSLQLLGAGLVYLHYRQLNLKPADKSSNGKAIAVLKWSNVGDSGVKVFRYGSVVASSPVQEHYFNCPRQLANPKKVKECDTPDVADGDEVQLQRGDVVVLATD